jgi:hypothetical protein
MVLRNRHAVRNFADNGLKNVRHGMTLTLDEAIESAKLSAGPDRILNQQHYEDLIQKLSDEERYPFTMALAELNIGPRTGHREAAQAVSNFLDSDTVSYVISSATGLSDQDIEDKLVYAAMHRDAGWWDDLKDKARDWWNSGPSNEYEEEFGEPFPMMDPGTEDMYDTTPDEVVTDYDFLGDQPLPPPPPGPPPVTMDPPGMEGTPEAVPPPPSGDFYQEFGTPAPDAPGGAFGDPSSIPEMTPVDSSNLEAVGFNDEDQMLYIIFKAKRNTPRTMYRYQNTDRSDYNALTNPGISAGQFFHQNIRSKPYSGPEDPAAYGV